MDKTIQFPHQIKGRIFTKFRANKIFQASSEITSVYAKITSRQHTIPPKWCWGNVLVFTFYLTYSGEPSLLLSILPVLTSIPLSSILKCHCGLDYYYTKWWLDWSSGDQKQWWFSWTLLMERYRNANLLVTCDKNPLSMIMCHTVQHCCLKL